MGGFLGIPCGLNLLLIILSRTLVFVPKFRKKTLYGKIRKYLKDVFHELAKQKGCEIVSGHMAGDHVHMCISSV